MKKKKVAKMIHSAIEPAGKCNTFKDFHIEMNLDVGEVVTELAQAITAQAIVNQANSEAIAKLAAKLQPVAAHAIHVAQTDEAKE